MRRQTIPQTVHCISKSLRACRHNTLTFSWLLMALIAVAPCTRAATKRVDGQVFLTRGTGESLKLAGVEVKAFDAASVETLVSNRLAVTKGQLAVLLNQEYSLVLTGRSLLAAWQQSARAHRDSNVVVVARAMAHLLALQKRPHDNHTTFSNAVVDAKQHKLDAEKHATQSKAAVDSASSALNRYRREWESLRDPTRLFEDFPQPIARAVSDADGKFSVQIPLGVRTALFAAVDRPVRNHWFVWITPKTGNDETLVLGPLNSFGANSSDQILTPTRFADQIEITTTYPELPPLPETESPSVRTEREEAALEHLARYCRDSGRTLADMERAVEQTLADIKQQEGVNDYDVEHVRLRMATKLDDLAHALGQRLPFPTPREEYQHIDELVSLHDRLVITANRRIDQLRGINPVLAKLLVQYATNAAALSHLRPEAGGGKPRTLAEAIRRNTERDSNGPNANIVSAEADRFPEVAQYDQVLTATIKKRWEALLTNNDFTVDRSGVVEVVFTLHSDGRAQDVRFIRNPVGNIFGVLCEKAILDPSPYPRWPSAMQEKVGKSREVRVTFNYQ